MAYTGAECHSRGLIDLIWCSVLAFFGISRYIVGLPSLVFPDSCVSSLPGLSNTSSRALRASPRHRDMEHIQYGKLDFCRVKKAASSLCQYLQVGRYKSLDPSFMILFLNISFSTYVFKAYSDQDILQHLDYSISS